MKCKIFILEDNINRMATFYQLLPVRFPDCEIVHATTVEEAKRLIDTSNFWDIVLLDHDLGGRAYVDSSEEETGYQFLKYFKRKKIKFSQLVFHSQNPAGAQNMFDLMPEGKIIPFPQLISFIQPK
jgi:hypothetical protein